MMHVCLQHIYSVYARNSGRCVLLYSYSMYLSAICVELEVVVCHTYLAIPKSVV